MRQVTNMAVGTINKITGILYIVVGITLMVLGIIIFQLFQGIIPLLETFAGVTIFSDEPLYLYALGAILILPWIFFIIHGVAHYLIGRQIE
jgi:hypothetical protein